MVVRRCELRVAMRLADKLSYREEMDLLNLLFDTYAVGKISGVSALQAHTDHRLSESTDRLATL